MSGVDIVSALLQASDAVTAVVARSRIKNGMLAQDIALPAIVVREISLVERLKLRRTGRVRFVSRVQVTIRANTYREQKAILALVISAVAGRTGTIAGAAAVAVTNASAGPDLIGESGIFEQPQDFRVTYETDA